MTLIDKTRKGIEIMQAEIPFLEVFKAKMNPDSLVRVYFKTKLGVVSLCGTIEVYSEPMHHWHEYQPVFAELIISDKPCT